MPRRRLIAALGVLTTLALLAAPTGALAAPRDPIVSGTVYGNDGIAIRGAKIAVSEIVRGTVRPITTLTADERGHWTYTNKAMTYRFDFSARGADRATRILGAARDGVYTLNVTLPSWGRIAGSISNASTALPLSGATVEFYRRFADGTWSTSPSATVMSLADGSYVSGLLPVGAYAVKVRAPGYEAALYGGATIEDATPVMVLRAATATASVALLPSSAGTGTIKGLCVSYAERTPTSGAFVWLYRQNADGTWPATSPGWGAPSVSLRTAADGTYTSGPIPLGNYKVRHYDWHFSGSQWWQYVPVFDQATVLTLSYDGQAISGIEAWFSMP